jgi:hypothetical protein
MLLEYMDIQANLYYCGDTKCYYGELLNINNTVVVQASSRQDAIIALHNVIEQWLSQFK